MKKFCKRIFKLGVLAGLGYFLYNKFMVKK